MGATMQVCRRIFNRILNQVYDSLKKVSWKIGDLVLVCTLKSLDFKGYGTAAQKKGLWR